MKIQAVKYYLTALYIVLCGHALATPIDTLNYIHEMRITDQIGSPLRVAIDKYDNVYVTDSFYEKIIKFNSAGEFQGKFSSGVSPLAIAIDSKDHLYTSDRKNGTIRVVDTSGVLLSSSFPWIHFSIGWHRR